MVMGIFFKSFTLVVLCLLVALAIVVSAVKAEYGRCAWLRAREQPNHAASVVLKAFDSAGRRGLGGFNGLENRASDAENVARSVVGTVRIVVEAEGDLVVREERRLRESGLIERRFGGSDEGGQPDVQKDRLPGQRAAEVVASGGEDGVGGVAGGVGDVVAAHPVLGIEVADARLESGSAA